MSFLIIYILISIFGARYNEKNRRKNFARRSMFWKGVFKNYVTFWVLNCFFFLNCKIINLSNQIKIAKKMFENEEMFKYLRVRCFWTIPTKAYNDTKFPTVIISQVEIAFKHLKCRINWKLFLSPIQISLQHFSPKMVELNIFRKFLTVIMERIQQRNFE